MQALTSRDRRAYLRGDFFCLLTTRLKQIRLTRFLVILLDNDLCSSIRRLTTYAALRTYRCTTGKQGGFRFEVVLISGRKSPNRRVFLLFSRRFQDSTYVIVKGRQVRSQFLGERGFLNDDTFRISIGTFAWLGCVYRTFVWGGNFVGLPRG